MRLLINHKRMLSLLLEKGQSSFGSAKPDNILILRQKGLIDKVGDKYRLTENGKRFAIQFQQRKVNKGKDGNMKTLKELREQWEKDMEVVVTIPIDLSGYKKLLVVLKNKNGCFSLHRYFVLGSEWTVSVDVQECVSVKTCFKVISEDTDYIDSLRTMMES